MIYFIHCFIFIAQFIRIEHNTNFNFLLIIYFKPLIKFFLTEYFISIEFYLNKSKLEFKRSTKKVVKYCFLVNI